jgi:hypothetical protein
MAVFQTNSQRDLYLDNIEKPIRKGARRGSLSTIQPTYQHSQVQDRNEKRSSRHSDVGLPEIQGTSTVIHQQPYHLHVEYYTPPMELSSRRMDIRISQLVVHSKLEPIPWPPHSCFTSLDFTLLTSRASPNKQALNPIQIEHNTTAKSTVQRLRRDVEA